MATKRSGPWSVIWRAIFATPFILSGLGALTTGISSRSATGSIFGVIFVGAGAFVVYTGIRDMRSAESRGQFMPRAPGAVTSAPLGPAAFGGYRASADTRVPTALELYGVQLPHLPVAKVPLRRGRTLTHALGRREPYAGWTLVLVSLVWNALCVPFFIGMLYAHSAGALFLLLFVVVGMVMLGAGLKRVMALRKLITIELDAEPAYLGDTITLHLAQRGAVNITRLLAALVCKEMVSYRVGTDTRKEEREVYREEILDEISLKVARGETWTRQLQITLPAGPASFKAPSNEVAWSISVNAEIDNWPDYDELFTFRALPKVSP